MWLRNTPVYRIRFTFREDFEIKHLSVWWFTYISIFESASSHDLHWRRLRVYRSRWAGREEIFENISNELTVGLSQQGFRTLQLRLTGPALILTGSLLVSSRLVCCLLQTLREGEPAPLPEEEDLLNKKASSCDDGRESPNTEPDTTIAKKDTVLFINVKELEDQDHWIIFMKKINIYYVFPWSTSSAWYLRSSQCVCHFPWRQPGALDILIHISELPWLATTSKYIHISDWYLCQR